MSPDIGGVSGLRLCSAKWLAQGQIVMFRKFRYSGRRASSCGQARVRRETGLIRLLTTRVSGGTPRSSFLPWPRFLVLGAGYFLLR